jgi:hypothetical protein
MFETTHPLTFDGARGAFDAYTRLMDMQNFQGNMSGASAPGMVWPSSQAAVYSAPNGAGGFDWKDRAAQICENIRKMGMNPEDFGCQTNAQAASQQSDFSWRGHTKMMCTRLATHLNPGMPEQVGCPPVSWKGWRT